MAFNIVPKVLISRVREESLSGKIFNTLQSTNSFDVDSLNDDWDITHSSTYPSNLGDYDVIFNCSGITLNEEVLLHNNSNAKKVFEVNVLGAMTLTTEYAKARKAKGLGGLIIHIGSMGSKVIFTNCSAYCASKAALAHYIECAAYELKKDGIVVIGVHPGNMIGTQMSTNVINGLINNRGMTPEQVSAIYKDGHDVQDVADICVNLLSFPLHEMSGENIFLNKAHKY